MTREGTRDAAEAVLRELPSVIGAFVREDVNGNPREVHLLVHAGPSPRHLAYDVRELLEERLGVHVDQRIISIAQLAEGRRPGPLLARAAGFEPLPDESSAELAAEPAAEPADARHDNRPAEAMTEPDPGAGAAPVPSEATALPEPRVRFAGISTDVMDNRVHVRVALDLGDDALAGEAVGLDTAPARLRAAAAAVLQAVNSCCVGTARFEVEFTAAFSAFDQDYVLVSVLASSPYLGRRPLPLVGAQLVDMDGESAAALAALKAVNRTLALVVQLPDSGLARPRPFRPAHS